MSSVSLIAQTYGHASLEVGLVGDEGMVGTSLMLGVNGYVYVTLWQLAQTAA